MIVQLHRLIDLWLYYLSIAPVLFLQLVGAVVLLLGVVHHHGGDGAALVLVRAHRVVRAVTELPVRGVPPREHRGRLPAALDLPERRAPGPDRLGARLALVDGRGNCTEIGLDDYNLQCPG